jgi:hypothetical protein
MDRTTEDDQLELSAVKSITAILEALNTGRPLPATSTTSLSVLSQDPSARPPVSKEAAEAYLVPAHLRDLKDEELPEENREVVLDQIALFRQQAVQRELEKKRNEEEAERRRLAAQAEQARLRAAGGASSSRQQESFSDTPQTYNRPVGFVAASSSSSAGLPERTDEEEELIRVERRRRDALDAVRERERRNDARERTRLVNVDRDLTSIRAREQEDEKEHFIARDRLALWDDDEVADRGRDLWFVDRPRWRAQRQLARRREEDADAADAVAEAAEREAARVAAEERAKEEAREQALLAEKQKAAGILTDETAPIKLTVAPLLHEGGVSGYAGAKKKDVKPAAGAGVKFVADDDEEEDAKKKRVLVKLDYGEGLVGCSSVALFLFLYADPPWLAQRPLRNAKPKDLSYSLGCGARCRRTRWRSSLPRSSGKASMRSVLMPFSQLFCHVDNRTRADGHEEQTRAARPIPTHQVRRRGRRRLCRASARLSARAQERQRARRGCRNGACFFSFVLSLSFAFRRVLSSWRK